MMETRAVRLMVSFRCRHDHVPFHLLDIISNCTDVCWLDTYEYRLQIPRCILSRYRDQLSTQDLEMQYQDVARAWQTELDQPELLETQSSCDHFEFLVGLQVDVTGLAACGGAVIVLLRSALSSILVETRSPKRGLRIATTLHGLADEQINSVHFQTVDPKWLQLYCDAAILHTLLDLARHADAMVPVEEWSAAVRRLDMAIIVGGPTGMHRRERIFALMRSTQAYLPLPGSRIPNISDTISLQPPTKRRRLGKTGDDIPLQYAPRAIKVLAEPPSIADFTSVLCQEPFIVRQYALKDSLTCPRWPAIERWASGDYLLRIAGPARVVPVEFGRAYDEESWTQRILPLEEFLGRAGFLGDSQHIGEPMYLAQYDLFRQIPELEKDMALPDYVWSEPPAPSGCPGYAPPETVLVNVWVGSGSSEVVSPPHTVSAATVSDVCAPGV